MFITEVTLRRDPRADLGAYPYSIPVLRHLERLHFTKPVTFFVGENGSGKSTLLEGIAGAFGLNPEGGTKHVRFATRPSHSTLFRELKLTKTRPASHGEAFLALVLNRLRGNGFYCFDEPEAALSPMRQLALLAAMRQLVVKGSQFIIATHSPLLLAYPDATIYSFGDGPPQVLAYRDTEHYHVTRAFLENPERMLRELMTEEST